MSPANQRQVFINSSILDLPNHWFQRRFRPSHHQKKQNHYTLGDVGGVDPHLNLRLRRGCKSGGGAVPQLLLVLGFLVRFLPDGCLAYQIANCTFSLQHILFSAARIVPCHSL
jgi:hypothetical protein